LEKLIEFFFLYIKILTKLSFGQELTIKMVQNIEHTHLINKSLTKQTKTRKTNSFPKDSK